MINTKNIKIKNIYLRQDFINEKAENLLKNTDAKINFIWPDQEYCGVKIIKEGNLNFSYQTEKIKAFDTMKKIFIEGKAEVFEN